LAEASRSKGKALKLHRNLLKQREKLKNNKKIIERMEIAFFSVIWKKPPKAKENLEN
jgi:hypothetical protein